MPVKVIAEGLVRLEHKIDAIMRHLQVKSRPMHFIGEACPVCSKPIDYRIDPTANVVARKCDCSSGKIPSGIPLLPIGETNVSSPTKHAAREGQAEDGYWSPSSEVGSGKLRG